MKVGIKEFLTKEIKTKIFEDFDILNSEITEIEAEENFVFDVKKNDENYILRISHDNHRMRKDIEAELNWVQYLLKNNLPVFELIPSNSGSYIVTKEFIDYENKLNHFNGILYKKIEGEVIEKNPELLTDDNVREWGILTAKLHLITNEFDDIEPKRRQWFEDPLIMEFDKLLKDYPLIYKKLSDTIDSFQDLPRNNQTYGLIHFDLHESNIVVNKKGLNIIDFDDCIYNWFIADIAVILFHVAWRFSNEKISREDIIRKFFPPFLEGYLSKKNISKFWIGKLGDFINYRHYLLFLTLVYEEKIEFDEWSNNLKKRWIKMFETDVKWLNIDFNTYIT